MFIKVNNSRESFSVFGVVGDILRQRRLLLGVSQKDCAELTGLSIHTISDIESGKGNPTLDVLEKLFNCLGLEVTVQPRKIGPSPDTL